VFHGSLLFEISAEFYTPNPPSPADTGVRKLDSQAEQFHPPASVSRELGNHPRQGMRVPGVLAVRNPQPGEVVIYLRLATQTKRSLAIWGLQSLMVNGKLPPQSLAAYYLASNLPNALTTSFEDRKECSQCLR